MTVAQYRAYLKSFGGADIPSVAASPERALAVLRLPVTWAVYRASFNNNRRFWLLDPCRLDSWRKVVGPGAGTLRTSSRAGPFSNGRKRRSAKPAKKRALQRTEREPEERPMVEERPRLAASEIEEELLAELQKLATLHDTQSVRIRPYSGPKDWTWELDGIEPEVGPTQSKFVDVATVVVQLQQQYDLDLSPPPPA